MKHINIPAFLARATVLGINRRMAIVAAWVLMRSYQGLSGIITTVYCQASCATSFNANTTRCVLSLSTIPPNSPTPPLCLRPLLPPSFLQQGSQAEVFIDILCDARHSFFFFSLSFFLRFVLPVTTQRLEGQSPALNMPAPARVARWWIQSAAERKRAVVASVWVDIAFKMELAAVPAKCALLGTPVVCTA